MTAIELGLHKNYVIISDFNKKSERKLNGSLHIFLLHKDHKIDELKKSIILTSASSKIKAVYLPSKDLSDFYNNDCTKKNLIKIINESEVIPITEDDLPIHGGARNGAGRPATQEVIEELISSDQIKEAVRYSLGHTQKGLTQEGRYLHIVDTILLPEFQKNGKFYLNKSERKFYYFDTEFKALYELPTNWKQGTPFSIYVNNKYGFNSAHAGSYLLEELKTEVHSNGTETVVHQLTYFDIENYLLYIDKYDNHIYKLNSKTIELVDNGTDGVLFLTSNYKTFEYLRGSRNVYSKLLEINFAPTLRLTIEEQKKLWFYSIVAKFFPQFLRTKPIDIFYGEKGSGKSLALKRLLWLFKGDQASLLNIPKNQRDLETQLTNNTFVFYDNMDERVENWVKDGVASSATGIDIQMSLLFHTNTKVEYKANPYLAIATRTARFIEDRDDIADRALVFNVKKIDKKVSEEDLFNKIISNRNLIMSSLMDVCNSVLNNLQEKRNESFESEFRMADFAKFVAFGFPNEWELNENIFNKMALSQSDLAADKSTLFILIDTYLESNKKLSGKLSEIYRLLKEFNDYRKEKIFSHQHFRNLFKANLSNLRIWFNVKEENTNTCGSQCRYNYTIKRTTENEQGIDKNNQENETAQDENDLNKDFPFTEEK